MFLIPNQKTNILRPKFGTLLPNAISTLLFFKCIDKMEDTIFTEHNIAFTTSSIQDYYIRLTYDFVENLSLFRQLSLNCHQQRNMLYP
jgi:hypothetical protein